MVPLLSDELQKRIIEIRRLLTSAKTHEDSLSIESESQTSAQAMPSQVETLRQELDDIVASECVFCSELAVK